MRGLEQAKFNKSRSRPSDSPPRRGRATGQEGRGSILATASTVPTKEARAFLLDYRAWARRIVQASSPDVVGTARLDPLDAT